MKYISDNLNRKAVGYCMYILSTSLLTEVDEVRKEKLMLLLTSDYEEVHDNE